MCISTYYYKLHIKYDFHLQKLIFELCPILDIEYQFDAPFSYIYMIWDIQVILGLNFVTSNQSKQVNVYIAKNIPNIIQWVVNSFSHTFIQK